MLSLLFPFPVSFAIPILSTQVLVFFWPVFWAPALALRGTDNCTALLQCAGARRVRTPPAPAVALGCWFIDATSQNILGESSPSRCFQVSMCKCCTSSRSHRLFPCTPLHSPATRPSPLPKGTLTHNTALLIYNLKVEINNSQYSLAPSQLFVILSLAPMYDEGPQTHIMTWPGN